MLFNVPIGMSLFGCGTVTRPFFVACLNCLWLPTCFTSYQPCFCSSLIKSLLFTTNPSFDKSNDTHFLHTLPIFCRYTFYAHHDCGYCQSAFSRDNLPNPVASPKSPYIPPNGPALGDLMSIFDFAHKQAAPPLIIPG